MSIEEIRAGRSGIQSSDGVSQADDLNFNKKNLRNTRSHSPSVEGNFDRSSKSRTSQTQSSGVEKTTRRTRKKTIEQHAADETFKDPAQSSVVKNTKGRTTKKALPMASPKRKTRLGTNIKSFSMEKTFGGKIPKKIEVVSKNRTSKESTKQSISDVKRDLSTAGEVEKSVRRGKSQVESKSNINKSEDKTSTTETANAANEGAINAGSSGQIKTSSGSDSFKKGPNNLVNSNKNTRKMDSRNVNDIKEKDKFVGNNNKIQIKVADGSEIFKKPPKAKTDSKNVLPKI
jgi:hypothetical protein